MEFRPRRFGGMQELATLNGPDCLADSNVRVRQRSGIHRDMSQRQVICPEPRRLPIVPSLADDHEIHKSGRRLHRFERREARQMRSIFARVNEEAFIYLLKSILVHKISFVSTVDSLGIGIS